MFFYRKYNAKQETSHSGVYICRAGFNLVWLTQCKIVSPMYRYSLEHKRKIQVENNTYLKIPSYLVDRLWTKWGESFVEYIISMKEYSEIYMGEYILLYRFNVARFNIKFQIN